MGLLVRQRWWALLPLALVLTLGGEGTRPQPPLTRPLPDPAVVVSLPESAAIPGPPPVLPWPAAGQAAIEVAGIGSLGSSGGDQPVPIASVAKVMTAYLILLDHPLAGTDEGPPLTVSVDEAAAYPGQVARNLSLVPVAAGEVLTERQALEALLLPSADNIAQILARWDAGDVGTFVARMNTIATGLRMTGTRYTDPSGLDKATVSTAVDQVRLAERAMALPALAGIVALPVATIPVAGVIRNRNELLGQGGFIGIKTGSTSAAGGCLLFAARLDVAGQPVTVFGAVLGQVGPPGRILPLVFAASQRLVAAVGAVVHRYPAVPAGTPVATVAGGTITTVDEIFIVGWPGLTVHRRVHLWVSRRARDGDTVGEVDVSGAGRTPVRLVR